ncbi:MAG: hypothetical protein WC343_01330 [Bacilli bacterium]
MHKVIDKQVILQFLNIVRKEIKKNNFVIEKRKAIDICPMIVDYRCALLDLSVTINDVKQIICKLEVEECIDISSDMDTSRDYNSEVFEFITYVNGIKTYIKLTMNDKFVVCISFHRSKK